jgi:sulfate adenylyltransferase large subunit
MLQDATLKFVIVGHVDHGKSTLIGRLLYDTDSLPPDKIEEIQKTSKDLGRETEFAYLLDHLEEERQQGVTIETTQVFFRTDTREYVIIDAPGHVEFVKNMITGASQAEAAVLIIDVAEGVREQTKRHAYILSMLGLGQVIVVLNKMDLVDFTHERFEEVKASAGAFLSSIGVTPMVYIPISAITGENIARRTEKMEWYDGPTFLASLDGLKNREPADAKPLLVPVQDAYKVGEKRIAVGRVEAGTIQANQRITVLPDNQPTAVSSIEKYPGTVDMACAGESIGITTTDPVFLDRGQVICEQRAHHTLTDAFKANIFWMSRKPFQKDERVTIRCATQETSCRVDTIGKRIDSSSLKVLEEGASVLENLEVGEVVMATKVPLVVKTFNDVQELGRFVLVRDGNICAGGIITEIG